MKFEAALNVTNKLKILFKTEKEINPLAKSAQFEISLEISVKMTLIFPKKLYLNSDSNDNPNVLYATIEAHLVFDKRKIVSQLQLM